MQLFLTSCILVFFGIWSGNVTKSALLDVTESTLLDVTDSTLPDVTESVQPDVTTSALLNVTSLPDVAETALFNVTETDLLDFIDPPPVDMRNIPPFKVGPEYYELLPNNSVFVKLFQIILDENSYFIENETLYCCIPKSFKRIEEEINILLMVVDASVALSMIVLFLHLVVFCLVPELRNMPGWNLAALCACLFASYALMFLEDINLLQHYYISCLALACTSHFFLLSSFLWMSIMSSSVFVSLLRATRKLRSSDTRFQKRKFGLNCLCAFGVALLFNISAVLVDTLEGVPEYWRPRLRESCLFHHVFPERIFFTGPVFLLTCLNFVLFAASACVIHANKRKCDQDVQKPAMPRRYMMYLRLSAIAGVTWIFGLLAIDIKIFLIQLVFILLNTLQGIFIFLGFTCSEKVKRYFREKILAASRSSEQSLTPTFQSYCVYSTDVDNTVDSSK